MVECDLAKVEVAGSNPVSRSNFRQKTQGSCPPYREGGRMEKPVRDGDLTDSHPRYNPTAPQVLIGAVAKW